MIVLVTVGGITGGVGGVVGVWGLGSNFTVRVKSYFH